MNRKNLTAAVLAGLAGVAGIAGTAQAVNQNPDGLGQVLIYPYYTVNQDNFTILSVVNTTDQAKAVKVRFLEGMNSYEVLDFNLYLSAYDVWAAAVVDDGNGGAAVQTKDTSCTVPGIETQADKTQEFFTLAYAGDGLSDTHPDKKFYGDDGPKGRDRLTEGYFEMIEMGVLYDTYGEYVADPVFTPASDATHVWNVLDAETGEKERRPADCAQLVRNWAIKNSVEGVWLDYGGGVGLESPAGGLFGGAAVINTDRGTMFSYDARALDDYSTDVQHEAPGDVKPGLNTGNVFEAYVFNNGDLVDLEFYLQDAVDAVSAVFMHDKIMNEYNVQDSLKAMSEWVVTFPTKREYTDRAVAKAPFTEVWSDYDGDKVYDGACELITLGDASLDEEDMPIINGLWDREETTLPVNPEDPTNKPPVFSPSIDPGEEDPPIPTSELCYEVNVIRFGDLPEDGSEYMGPSEILGSSRVLAIGTSNDSDDDDLDFDFQHGWAMINLLSSDDPNDDDDNGAERWLIDDDGMGLGGLPVTGFWALSFENGFLGDGKDVLANYSGVFDHKATRKTSRFLSQTR